MDRQSSSMSVRLCQFVLKTEFNTSYLKTKSLFPRRIKMFGLSIYIKYSSEDSNQGNKSRNKSIWTGKEQAKLYLQITGSRLQKIQRNLYKILALIMGSAKLQDKISPFKIYSVFYLLPIRTIQLIH